MFLQFLAFELKIDAVVEELDPYSYAKNWPDDFADIIFVYGPTDANNLRDAILIAMFEKVPWAKKAKVDERGLSRRMLGLKKSWLTRSCVIQDSLLKLLAMKSSMRKVGVPLSPQPSAKPV